jgi:hypothetical protein
MVVLKALADQAPHSHVAVGTIEPPRLVHRTPAAALAGETQRRLRCFGVKPFLASPTLDLPWHLSKVWK